MKLNYNVSNLKKQEQNNIKTGISQQSLVNSLVGSRLPQPISQPAVVPNTADK